MYRCSDKMEKRTLGDVDSNEPLVSHLRSKYAEKPWNETIQLVRRCMDKSRSDPRSSQLLLSCLERLHGALNVSSLMSMVSKLEMIAKQRGLGSHLSPTETTCYLTSDLFYLEVLLLPSGDVEDVKVAHHGEAPVSCEPLLKLLRSKRYEDFSLKLDCLSSLYNIPGDNEMKLKVYTALKHLEKDLIKISQLPRPLLDCDLNVDMILNGRIGRITPQREGNPLSIEYYISPYDLLTENANIDECIHGQMALVTAGPSDSTHRLQKTSLIPQPPQITSEGLPVFSPLDDMTSESLPACFILKLQPPLPMLSSSISRVHHITETPMRETDLQWSPFPRLLETSREESSGSGEKEDAQFFVPLPENQMHSYLLPGEQWGVAALKGALVSSIPFTHPAHVPALLEQLRQQSALNTLLSSCMSRHRPVPGTKSDLHCEVLPESESSFSVSFLLPESDRLSVLSVNLKDSHQITSRLFTSYPTDFCTDKYISRVLKRCMSIPLVMRAICRRLVKKTSSSVVTSTLVAGDRVLMGTPASQSHTAASEADAPSIPPVEPETIHTDCPPALPSHNASVTDSSDVPASSVCSYYVMSVPTAPDTATPANTEPLANPYPGTHVGVFPSWSASSTLSI